MTAPLNQRGAALIELLIAMLIIAFGVLGFVGMQMKTALSQVEGHQRSQAVFLINDIAARISLNRANTADYLGTNFGIGSPADCTAPTTQAQKDLCEWSELLKGAAETQGSAKLGAMIGARGCIVSDPSDTSAGAILISIAWQGVQTTGAPGSECGQNQYSAENLRRTVNKAVQFATLNTP